jgi:hypothetical protein
MDSAGRRKRNACHRPKDELAGGDTGGAGKSSALSQVFSMAVGCSFYGIGGIVNFGPI